VSRSLIVFALFLSGLHVGSGHADSCPTILGDPIRTWDALYKSFKSYRQCDDGAIAEGYSESVARILVDRWNTLPQLARLVRKDADFRSFVLKHVDATLDITDVQKIRKKAREECPAGLREICKDLGKQANFALTELDQTGK
jgi:hypothetical protein